MEKNAIAALRWLILFWVAFCVATLCGAEQATLQSVKPYPDLWYRSFEGQDVIFALSFSDPELWDDEAVVIMINHETDRGIAVGFFSGKSSKIYRLLRKEDDRYHLYYSQTKREMVRRYILPQKGYESTIKTGDGGELVYKTKATLSRGGIIDELFPEDIRKKIHEDTREDKVASSLEEAKKMREDYSARLIKGEISYASFNMEAICEPATAYLMKRDKSGKVIWAKSFVRYYPDRERAPKQTEDRCSEGKIRIASQAKPRLLLPDGTVLVVAPEAVVRIRQDDGGTEPIPTKTLRVFDAVDVIKAKLELIQKEAAALKKCAEEGEDLRASPKCGQYRIDKNGFAIGEDDEQLQLDLARRLFFNNTELIKR